MKFALGFNTELRFLPNFRHQTGFLLQSLLAVMLLIPFIPLALVEAMDLPYGIAAALLLLSASPAASFAPFKANKAFGIYAYAVSLQFWLTLLAVISLPAELLEQARLGLGGRPRNALAYKGANVEATTENLAGRGRDL